MYTIAVRTQRTKLEVPIVLYIYISLSQHTNTSLAAAVTQAANHIACATVTMAMMS